MIFKERSIPVDFNETTNYDFVLPSEQGRVTFAYLRIIVA